MNEEFKKELQSLINKHSIENDSDTPDYILAEYLMGCLDSFNNTTKRRDTWYGFKPWLREKKRKAIGRNQQGSHRTRPHVRTADLFFGTEDE
jgi:hypothetical protein